VESMHASVKFKEIGGISYRDWDAQFNLIQHGTTYQGRDAWESPGCRPAAIASKVVHGHPKLME